MKSILETFEENLRCFKDSYQAEREIVVGQLGTSLATYSTGVLTLENGRDLYVAKKKDNTSKGIDLKERFLRDLWAIDRIDRSDIENFGGAYRHSLPVLYGLIVNQHGEAKSVITEDFTQRNRYFAQPLNFAELIPTWTTIFQDASFDVDEMCRLGSRVNGEVKFYDFETKAEKLDLSKFEKILHKLTIEIND